VTIRILVVDDQALIRGGLRALIDSEEDLEVVGEAVDGLEAVVMARSCRADVILMDIRMPGLDGIEATRRITSDEDLAGVRILILTTFELDENVLLALRAGASGFLGKGSAPGELLAAVRTVAAGDALLSPKATQTLISQYLARPDRDETTAEERLKVFAVLTNRERDVVTMVAQGQTNDEIAQQFFVSPVTVKTHLNRAMTKLNIRDRAQLVVLAFQTGLVRPD
jgi:DNA-binding NarL/FixJ family response regulator